MNVTNDSGGVLWQTVLPRCCSYSATPAAGCEPQKAGARTVLLLPPMLVPKPFESACNSPNCREETWQLELRVGGKLVGCTSFFI